MISSISLCYASQVQFALSFSFSFDFEDGKLWARHRLQALALAIYGAVVFPGEPGLIDGHISTLIEQMGTGCSVVPMILGEVIRSLSYCFSHGHGTFLGCAALLKLVKV